MNDEDKTREQLITELRELRRRLKRMEHAGPERSGMEGDRHARPPDADAARAMHERDMCFTVLNTTVDGAFFMDTEGKAVFVNETIARWLHTTKEELIDANMFDVIPEPWRSARKAYADRVVLTKEPQRFEDERHGRWTEHRMYPIVGPDGEVSHVAVYSIDITGQKQLEEGLRESEAKYRALIEGIPAVTYITDLLTGIAGIYVSPQAYAVLGLTPEEVRDRSGLLA